jgi:hypothetical protein
MTDPTNYPDWSTPEPHAPPESIHELLGVPAVARPLMDSARVDGLTWRGPG